ncbi:acyl-CoA dehydrogenase family protein [Bordetella genomosp. 13]|uniref:acyl-CoA dehydrogenase family protein n=1 Tax=Bordetella genomosp. 13 TaxID=463040 RepID=UPI0021B54217|nr:acyl-CoA dehydrogenase family protein [Bordetella genomosp. 13]
MQAFSTHQVANQVPPLEDYSLYDTDPVLRAAVAREGAGAWQDELREHGAWLGRAQTLQAAELANRHGPILHAYDRAGHRVDQIEFHPAWAQLMSGIVARGLHSNAWLRRKPGAQAARAAAYLMQGQAEAGTLCPTTMTHAAMPLLMREPAGDLDYARDWLPALYSRQFDGSDAPLSLKRGALIGMGLTEKQGGSDLRAVATRAVPLGTGGRGRAYLLTGHKWFFSVPQADAHLVLARVDGGLSSAAGPSCFVVPRWVPDGPRNAVRVRRLKDKVGNRSNASAEVEFEQAWGVMLGEPGRGLAVLLEMAAATRLDCVLGSAALLRQALAQALHHAAHRQAFGRRLLDQPVMRGVLADLALESEAATLLAMRLARAADHADRTDRAGESAPEQRADGRAPHARGPDDHARYDHAWNDHTRDGHAASERALLRVGTPAAKLWICKRAIAASAEAMEALGGNGYVEDGPLGRIYRETPVNSIWEGSGNVMALDVLRALGREAEALPALCAELDPARGVLPAYDRALDAWLALLQDPARAEPRARTAAAGLARLWQAALLIRHAPAGVAAAFAATRLGQGASLFGEWDDAYDAGEVLARAWPGMG